MTQARVIAGGRLGNVKQGIAKGIGWRLSSILRWSAAG